MLPAVLHRPESWQSPGLARVKKAAGKAPDGDGASGLAIIPTEAQAQQKRDAAKRERLLRNAQDFVKQKWLMLCGLKGRDHATSPSKTATGSSPSPTSM